MLRQITMSLLGTLIICSLAAPAVHAAQEFYVSLDGNDDWTGELPDPNTGNTDGPFATLGKARATIREIKSAGSLPYGGITVYIREGIYYRSETFTLDSQDSGTEDSPIVWSAYPGETVHLMGGRFINNFGPVADADISSRFYDDARDHILQANLFDLGITSFNDFTQSSGPGMELFFASEPMTISRFPNDDWLTIFSVPTTCEEPYVGDPRTIDDEGNSHGMHCGYFSYENKYLPQSIKFQLPAWQDIDNIWMFGYWYWDWSSMYQKVENIDNEEAEVWFSPPYHFYGYREGQRYYFLNILEEIDRPGEWYLDTDTGMLYFWPPSSLYENAVFISSLNTDMVQLEETSFVTIKDFLFEGSRSRAVMVNGGTNNLVDGCEVRNVSGETAIQAGNVSETGIVNCHIYNIAGSGISLSGGDRTTLTSGENYVVNNHIHDFARVYRTYHSGIHVSGVGNRIAHNEIHDAPHAGLFFSGNDHIIEYNEIHDIAQETHDVGVVYNGRDFTQRGTIVRYNFFHNNENAYAIYYDDILSGNITYGNVVYKNAIGVIIGGGRNNSVENNIFIENGINIYVDSRGLSNSYFDPDYQYYDSTILDRINAIDYTNPPWSKRYPELVTVLDDEPGAPKYNTISRNIIWNGTNLYIDSGAQAYVTPENNLMDVDPLFVDYAAMNFQLLENSPAYSEIGFEPIPFEEMGLLKDDTHTGVQNLVPEKVRLEQNNPNPFNPTTSIQFSIPGYGMVRLKVYNMLGQVVGTLVDGRMTGGVHRVMFDGSDLGSGIYIYRIEYGEVAETRKMLLIK